MLRRGADLLQILFGLFRRFRVIEGDVVQPDDGIHRRADLMAHIGEEGRLRLVGLLRRGQGVAEDPALLLQLFLHGDPMLQLLLLDPVLGIDRLLFQLESSVSPVLRQHQRKHGQHHQQRQHGLENASPDDAVRNGTDLVADHALADQIGEEPVGSLHGNVTERLTDPVVGEGGLAPVQIREVLQDFFVGIARLILRVGQGVQQIVLHGQAAQDRVAQGDAAVCVDVGKGRVVALGLHGHSLQHPVHGDLHETHHKLRAVKRNAPCGNGNDDGLVRGPQILDGDLRPGKGVIVETVFVDIRPNAQGGVDQAVVGHKGEFFQAEKALHFGLVGLKMLRVAEILFRHQRQSGLQIGEPPLQVVRHHLFPPSGQLVQIEEADRPDSLFGIALCALPDPQGTKHHNHHNHHDADDSNQSRVFSSGIHNNASLLTLCVWCSGCLRPARKKGILLQY